MPGSVDESFARDWQAEVLRAAPLIAPASQYVYPRQVPGEEETIARGALQAVLSPGSGGSFLATFALGFADARLPSGLWSCPVPHELCAVAGGYAYVLNTREPRNCTFLPLRPVVRVLPLTEARLLVFVGLNELSAWGARGLAWTTARLSWEGVTVDGVDDGQLNGLGWDLHTDREVPFRVDLATGTHTGGGFLPGSR